MTRFLKDEERAVTHSVSFPKELRDKIITLAENEKRSFSQVVNMILQFYFKDHVSLAGLTDSHPPVN